MASLGNFVNGVVGKLGGNNTWLGEKIKDFGQSADDFLAGTVLNPSNPNNPLVGERTGLLTNPEGVWDKFKNGSTNDINKAIADENLEYQRENLDYNKALQQQIFEREDTSYQRTLNDMRQSGMSPFMMQGTNGAGEAVSTDALHNDYQHSDMGDLNAITGLIDLIQGIQGTSAQTNSTSAQARKTNAEAQLLEDTHDATVSNAFSTAFLNANNLADSDKARDFNEYFNLHSGMSPNEREAAIFARSLGINSQDLKSFSHNLTNGGRNDLFSTTSMGPDNFMAIGQTQVANKAIDKAGAALSELLNFKKKFFK